MERKTVGSLAGLALLPLGGVTLWYGLQEGSTLLTVAGIVVAAAGLLALGGVLRSAGEHRPGVWIVGGLVGVAVGLLMGIGLSWAVGASLIVAGLTSFRVGIRAVVHRSDRGARQVAAAGVGGVFLGVMLVLDGVLGRSLALTGVGLLFVVAGLIPLSLGWLHLGLRTIRPSWAIVAGVMAVAAALVLWPTERPEWLPWVAAAVLVAAGASFSWRLEGAVAVLLTAMVLALVLADRVDQAPLDPQPDAPDRILALGDSYSSGEGATRFFPGTNAVGDLENQCRRTSTAYPYLVASRLEMGLDFFACSGATTSQVYEVGQMGPESPDHIPGELPQLEYLTDTSRIRVVLLTIGGNDAGFGRIGIACGLPGQCDAFREHWLTRVARIGRRLEKTYRAIKTAVGRSTPVVVIPYPRVLTEGGCGWSALDRSEHDFLFEFITVLDDRIRRSAERAGVNFFEQGMFAFEGQRICEAGGPDDTVMNFLNFVPTDGRFTDRVDPTNWIHGTFHPKPTGHQAMADELAPWLRQLLADIDAGLIPPNPPPNPDATFLIRRVSSVETVAADPRGLPTDIACPVGKVSAFATLLPLLNARTTFTLHAAPEAPICHTRPDGTWTEDETGVITRSGAVATVQPELPAEGWTQRFIYREASEGTWQQHIVEFCNRKEGCPTDVGRWLGDQLVGTARSAAMPGVMMLLGGWVVGVGLKGRERRGGGVVERPKERRTPWPGMDRALVAAPGKAVVISCLILTLSVVGVWTLLSPGPPGSLRTDAAPYGIISLQVAGSASQANRVLSSWEGERLEGARDGNLIDYGFIVFYSFLLSVGVLAAGEAFWRGGRTLLWRMAAVLAWLVFVAGLLDAIENVLVARMIDVHAGGGVVEGDLIPRVSSLLAWPKIVLLAIAMIYVFGGTALGLRTWLANEGSESEKGR